MLSSLPFLGRTGVLPFRRQSRFRLHNNDTLRRFTAGLTPATVLNVGATPDGKDKEGRRYADYFPGAAYWTTDQSPHDAPNHVQGDITRPGGFDRQFDLVLAMSVLEHVERPWDAARVLTDLIAPGGHLFVAMPFFYPLHPGKDFGDYWRWTPEANAILFPDLTVLKSELYPTSLVAVRDRKSYWRDWRGTFTGFSQLLHKP